MCGIVGATGQRDVAEILLTGLERLEYRGYDSAGVAIINQDQQLTRARTRGKVAKLSKALEQTPLPGTCGIAHTRWATHGAPEDRNAHPHVSNDSIAVVHNGIIENHSALREKLNKLHYDFTSDTDSEIIVHLIHYYYQQSYNLLSAVTTAVGDLSGAYAIAVIHIDNPHELIAARHGSPLVIGFGLSENFIASDQLALANFAKEFIFLEEGDIASINHQAVKVYSNNQPVERPKIMADLNLQITDKGQFRHFMQKEIFDQPQALLETLDARVTDQSIPCEIFGTQAKDLFPKIKTIQIVACGTSYHAGLVAKYWLEEIAGVPTQVEIASEFRYRTRVTLPGTLFLTISQSGETADTLAALRQAKQEDFLATLGICNVPTSTLVREADLVLMTRAGVEIGVASTKAFTTQLVTLLLLTLSLAEQRGKTNLAPLIASLKKLPNLAKQVLDLSDEIEKLAETLADKNNALFLGRGIHYPIALEGALKLKEISYIHAEAYPAGELKHGPLALVDEKMPVITIAPNDELLEKLQSNIAEVSARGGQLIVFADKSTGIKASKGLKVILLPTTDKIISPIINTMPLQLLAYHVAVIRGTDVDQPRNLAKSVTVE